MTRKTGVTSVSSCASHPALPGTRPLLFLGQIPSAPSIHYSFRFVHDICDHEQLIHERVPVDGALLFQLPVIADILRGECDETYS